MTTKPQLVKTREVIANRKIPLPAEVRELLTDSGRSDSVSWNVHRESQTIVLSNRPVLDDDHQFVGLTNVLDDGRYIRPPEDLPKNLLDQLEEEEFSTKDVLTELFDTEEEQLKEELAEKRSPRGGGPIDTDEIDERLSEPVKNSVVFVVYDTMLMGDLNKILLMTKNQMQERMPSPSDIFRTEEDLESFDPFDLPEWGVVSTDSNRSLE